MRRRLAAMSLAALLSWHAPARAQTSDHYVLSMIWMPGLCKLEPDREECKELSLRRYDGRNLAFFALQSASDSGRAETFCFTFPSDDQMEKDRRWCEMDKLKVANTMAETLKELMPVTQSCQDRGLWARYATCTLYSVNDYYSRAIKLARAVAGTRFNSMIAAAGGTTVSQEALVEAFKTDFGDDSATAINFTCRKVDGRFHLYTADISLTARGLTRGLAKEYLWKPDNGLKRNCPENILVDPPPVAIPASTTPPPPPAPANPMAVPVGPVETEPLSPPAGQ